MVDVCGMGDQFKVQNVKICGFEIKFYKTFRVKV